MKKNHDRHLAVHHDECVRVAELPRLLEHVHCLLPIAGRVHHEIIVQRAQNLLELHAQHPGVDLVVVHHLCASGRKV